MKLITANKLNRFWKNGILPKIREKIDKTKVLTTSEQVSANTNKENVASAIVTKELINDLTRQPQFIYDTAGKITGYKTQAGADTVFPFNSVKFYTPKLILGGYNAYKLGNFCFSLKNVNKIKFTVSDILTSSESATWQYTDGNITKIITKGNTYEYIVSNDTLEFMIKGISTVYSLLTLTNFEIS